MTNKITSLNIFVLLLCWGHSDYRLIFRADIPSPPGEGHLVCGILVGGHHVSFSPVVLCVP